MSHRPYPDAGRARRQLARHVQPIPVRELTEFERRRAQQAGVALAALSAAFRIQGSPSSPAREQPVTYRPYPDVGRARRQLARHYPGPPSLRDPDAYEPRIMKLTEYQQQITAGRTDYSGPVRNG